MKSRSQIIRSKKRLCIYLLKLSARGEEVQINLRKLISEIYNETGEIFAQTGYDKLSAIGHTSVSRPSQKSGHLLGHPRNLGKVTN